MAGLNSLIQQPSNSTPPDTQGASGTNQPSGMQSLMGGAHNGAGGLSQGPSHQETTALLQHLSYFRRRWSAMLSDPEVGTKNMRPEVYDLMADSLLEDYATLPEVMGLLKSLPTQPLEQKQWIEKHIQQDDQAMQAVLQHYAASRPVMGSFEEESAQANTGEEPDRAELVRGAVSRFKAIGKNRQRKSGRIPIA